MKRIQMPDYQPHVFELARYVFLFARSVLCFGLFLLIRAQEYTL